MPLDKYNEEPDDTIMLLGKQLPILDIRPLLRKVKLKNCPEVLILTFRAKQESAF